MIAKLLSLIFKQPESQRAMRKRIRSQIADDYKYKIMASVIQRTF